MLSYGYGRSTFENLIPVPDMFAHYVKVTMHKGQTARHDYAIKLACYKPPYVIPTQQI